jgi:hypothetical protein
MVDTLPSAASGNPWLAGPLLDPDPAAVAMAHPNDLGGRCIILASHGRTGTNWIMRALNAHPDFFCTHSVSRTNTIPFPGSTDIRPS